MVCHSNIYGIKFNKYLKDLEKDSITFILIEFDNVQIIIRSKFKDIKAFS